MRAVLDPAIADPHLRRTIYQRIPLAVLRWAAAESDRIVRPLDDSYFDFFETRYGYLRQCTPAFLETFTFHASQPPNPLLEAVTVVQQLNTTYRRTIPPDARTAFVSKKWRPYVVDPDGALTGITMSSVPCGSCGAPYVRVMSGSRAAGAMPIPIPT